MRATTHKKHTCVSVTFETNIYRKDCIFSTELRAKWGLYIFKSVTAEDTFKTSEKSQTVSVWHLFLRSNRRREKQGRWSQTWISSLDSALIHLLALTRHPRWANTHKTRGSLKADNEDKRLRTKLPVSMNHWSWSLPPPQTTIHSDIKLAHLFTDRSSHGDRERPDVTAAQVLSFPLVAEELQLSFFLIIQTVTVSHLRNKSSGQRCHINMATRRKWWHVQMHSEWWPFHARTQADLTSLSCGGSWWRSCLMRCFSPGLFTYGTLSSGKEL